MYKRVCDKCKKDIPNKYWEISREHYSNKGGVDAYPSNWHLCEECYKEIQILIASNSSYAFVEGN